MLAETRILCETPLLLLLCALHFVSKIHEKLKLHIFVAQFRIKAALFSSFLNYFSCEDNMVCCSLLEIWSRSEL